MGNHCAVRACPPGLQSTDQSTCVACPAGTYKATTGSACSPCVAGKYGSLAGRISETACSDCPNHTDSGNGSDNVTQCICNKGYTGPDGGSCGSCMSGTYKQFNGSSACTMCGRGKFSNLTGESVTTQQPTNPMGKRECARVCVMCVRCRHEIYTVCVSEREAGIKHTLYVYVCV